MKTINLKGKQYCQVVERLKAFRESYPNWSILTEYAINDQRAVFTAKILDENGRVVSMGHGMKNVNAEFNLEKVETRAVGRALAFLGLGVDGSIASAEEVMESTGERPKGE